MKSLALFAGGVIALITFNTSVAEAQGLVESAKAMEGARTLATTFRGCRMVGGCTVRLTQVVRDMHAAGVLEDSQVGQLVRALQTGTVDETQVASAYPQLKNILPIVAGIPDAALTKAAETANAHERMCASTTDDTLAELSDWVLGAAGKEHLPLIGAPAETVDVEVPEDFAQPFQVSANQQSTTLDSILRRVQSAVAAGHKPIVEIGIDLTALRPDVRANNALRILGTRLGVETLTRPEELGLRPGPTAESFGTFVEAMRLAERYPGVDWTNAATWYEQLFWTQDWNTDTVAPGLAAYVKDIREAGGTVVFNTSRPDFTRGVTEGALTDAGVEVEPGSVRMHDNLVLSAAEQKVAQAGVRGGTVVAFFDDNTEVLRSVRSAHPDAVTVRVIPRGFTSDATPEQLAQEFHRIGDFERR